MTKHRHRQTGRKNEANRERERENEGRGRGRERERERERERSRPGQTRERERERETGRSDSAVRAQHCGAESATLFEAVQPVERGLAPPHPRPLGDRCNGQPSGWEMLTTADGLG